MSPQVHLDQHVRRVKCAPALISVFLLVVITFLSGACSQIEKPNTNAFYAATVPPPKQEFRWSNGKSPKSIDPALAAAPPETDIARALYEGLTELDSKSLKPLPGVAEKWSSSDDFRTWTFQLRSNAKWSNGEPVTAGDFVRSWKRLASMDEAVENRRLLANIEGFYRSEESPSELSVESPSLLPPQDSTQITPLFNRTPQQEQSGKSQGTAVRPNEQAGQSDEQPRAAKKTVNENRLGVEALNDFILKVSLVRPDPDFPSLVAHPAFRPIFGDGKYFYIKGSQTDIITNGSFRISGVLADGITLDRADYYWNKAAVKVERVRFLFFDDAEKALSAYRSGEIDALTNADFEPLALKLLAPFEDFRQTTHSALNFYEFNITEPPYNDRRIREALTISIDRKRLTEGEMKGSAQPALNFFPFAGEENGNLSEDVEKAKKLLESAGYPDGEDFPTIRLLVNRNDTQQRIARTVAKMWKENLNLNTEIIVKETADMNAERKNGGYDLIRRNMVFPTTDDTANLIMLFTPENQPFNENRNSEKETPVKLAQKNQAESDNQGPAPKPNAEPNLSSEKQMPPLTADAALFDFRAIPLYFPTSYSLVKPYVNGFEINSLDAPSLKEVVIDYSWQPKGQKGEP